MNKKGSMDPLKYIEIFIGIIVLFLLAANLIPEAQSFDKHIAY